MDYKNFIDLHVHTDNSPDGNHSTMFLCESAVDKHLRAVAFTDHCETDAFYTEHYDRSVRQAFFEVAKAQRAYRGSLLILNGIELAQPTYDTELAEKILSMQKYDMVLGSIHNLRGREDFYYIPSFEPGDVDALVREYLKELALLADWGKFDSLAHLTYPLRYFFARSQITVDICVYKKEIDEILSILAEKDLALEINAAGLRQPIHLLSPERDIVKRFHELGGKLITLGSDAHFAEHLGAGLDIAAQAALDAGFTSTVLFQNRQPVEIPIK